MFSQLSQVLQLHCCLKGKSGGGEGQRGGVTDGSGGRLMGCRNALCSFQMHSHKSKVFYFVVIRHCCFWCGAYWRFGFRISDFRKGSLCHHQQKEDNKKSLYRHMLLRITINCHLFVCLGSLIRRGKTEAHGHHIDWDTNTNTQHWYKYKSKYTTIVWAHLSAGW